jgi:hypothetical protein
VSGYAENHLTRQGDVVAVRQASQDEKERVANAYNTAVEIFKARPEAN